jgi:hypothetical protein
MPLGNERKETMTANESNHQATDESGTDSKGSKTLAILKELKELNEDRLRELDEKIGADGTEVRMPNLIFKYI